MRVKLLKSYICFILLMGLSGAGVLYGATDSLHIPIDPEVRIGKLANGFTYYLRKNSEPRQRAVFYLANKVGSILEEENERGLAHFLEHVSFKGTTHFPENKMIDYLQGIGVRFGADLNAYTSFDETVYQLPLPTADAQTVQQGLQIMRDWAADAVIDSMEMEKERGVILEEKRLRKGAGERMQEQYFPILLNGSRYVHRMPIGTAEVIGKASPTTLKAFYKRWYRPNLQAFIAVGDLDMDALEKQVIALFSDLENPQDAPDRPEYRIPMLDKNQFLQVTDPEYTNRVVQMMLKHPAQETSTKDDLRRQLLIAAFNYMMQGRLSELSKQEKPPFIQGGCSFGGFFNGIDATSIVVAVKEGAFEQGFKAVYGEIERVKRQGFTESELLRTKEAILNQETKAFHDKDKRSSQTYVDEYLAHFLKGSPIPGQDYMYQYYQEIVPTLSLDEIQAVSQAVFEENSRDILVMGPEREKDSLPSEADILQWMEEVALAEVQSYQDLDVGKALMDELPSAKGSISSEKYLKDLDATLYTLSNGVKVILKTTDFKNDEIRFQAFSPGGNTLYPDADYQSAINAVGLVANSGVGQWDAIQLPKVLSGKQVAVSPYISDKYEGFQGSSSIGDLETAFQLIYLLATEPRVDSLKFKGLIENYKSTLVGRPHDPQSVFADTVNAILGNYHSRRTGPSLEKVSQIKLDKAFDIYRDRFADMSDFTFVFTGSLQDSLLKPLLETYLAAMPVLNRKEKGKDIVIPTPKGYLRKEVRKGKEDKATVQLLRSGKYRYGAKSNMAMRALEEVMNFRMTERLRKQESGVYTPSVSVSYSNKPHSEYRIAVGFGCAPQRIDTLIKAVEEEWQKLIDSGPTDEELSKFVAETKIANETKERTNAYWLSYLVGTYRNGYKADRKAKDEQLLRGLGKKDVQSVAKKYLDSPNYMQFILLPETD